MASPTASSSLPAQRSLPIRRVTSVALALLLTAASGCMHVDSASRDDQVRDIEFGQTVTNTFAPMSPARLARKYDVNSHTYRFRAEGAERITATVRSEGPDITLWVNKGFERKFWQGVGVTTCATDSGFTPAPNAEIMTILPINKKGEYSLELRSREPGPYSLTLIKGYAPNLELWDVPEPLPPSEGEFKYPLTKEGEFAPWLHTAIAEASNKSATHVITAAAVGAAFKAFTGPSTVDLGQAVDYVLIKRAALNTLGGWEGLAASSDFSFHTATDLALYLHLMASNHPQYQQILENTCIFWPKAGKALVWEVEKRIPKDDLLSKSPTIYMH